MKTFVDISLRLKNALISLEKVVAAISLLLLLIFTLLQIIFRNMFDYGFPQLDIISRHLVLFVLFMGAALISEKNNHIKIDILSAYLTDKMKKNIEKPLLLITAMICFLFSWFSAKFWLDEYTNSQANELFAVYLALILPLGFIILGLHFSLLTITGFSSRPITIISK